LPKPPASARAPFRLSRRLIILLSVVAVLVIAGGAAAMIVTNILRGGADTPEQAVTKSIDAISKKDLVGLFTMVSPHERDAIVRVQDSFVNKAKDLNLAEAAKSVAPKDSGQGSSELAFDGVDVTFSGVQPTVSQISEDVAVVRISSGEIKLHVDPGQTKGALRSIFDNVETQVWDHTVDISDLGPSRSGLSVLATKKDGRWYVNLAMSALEAVNNYQGLARGAIPASLPDGSDNPQTAAKAAVQSAQSQNATQVAPFLIKEEAEVLYLYGHLWNKLNTNGSSFSFGSVDFTEGPHEANRAQAYVNQINVISGNRDRFTLTDKCINNSSSSQSGNCLNGSAYQSTGYGTGGINWVSVLLSHEGKFALTTVNENGKWKVSLLDTVADHLVSAVKSLTREQGLAITTLARSDSASGSMALGESKNLDFNNAGYAVTTLKLDKPLKLRLDKQSTLGSVSLYSADGKEEVGRVWSSTSVGSAGQTYEAGEYKVVAWAGSDFREAFEKDGNSARISAPLSISEYVEPASFNGYDTSLSSTYITSSRDKSITVKVPSAAAGALLVKVTSASPGARIVATVDGQSYQVDGSEGKVTGIPVAVGDHKLTLRAESPSSRSQFSSSYAYVDLSFENQ
jgi:hypothetical protein